jgi:hypothetical protein
MDATIQGVLIVGLLLIPGFVHYTIAKATRVSEADDTLEIVVIFTSLGITASLIAVELLAIGLAALRVTWMSERLSTAFNQGFQQYGATRPGELMSILAGFFLANTIVLALAATLDPMGSVVERLLRERRRTKKSALFYAFRPDDNPLQQNPKQENVTSAATSKKDKVAATVPYRSRVVIYMTGEELPRYAGWVSNADLTPDRSGERFVRIRHAVRRTSQGWTSMEKQWDSSVLLKLSEISTIEFTYFGREGAPSELVQRTVLPSLPEQTRGLIRRIFS